MFLHVFRYRLLNLVRARWCVGWNLAFPILIATAFFFGFGSLLQNDPDALQVVPVALVAAEDSSAAADSAAANGKTALTGGDLTAGTAAGTASAFAGMVRSLGETGENQLFTVTEAADQAEAEQLLADGKVDGIYVDGAEPSLIVRENGMNQTILSEFLNEYTNNAAIMKQAAESNPAGVETAAKVLSQNLEFVTEKKFEGASDTSPFLQYFYALIGMACLYGSWITTSIVESSTANQSKRGARYECAPVPKWISILSGSLAGLIFVYGSVLVLIFYIRVILRVQIGSMLVPMLVTALLGAMSGVATGLFIGVVTGKNTGLKVGIPIMYSMLCCFLGGMMYGSMKQIIEVKAPLINRLNPAALIGDSLYTANTYGITARYYTDCLYLLAISAACAVISILLLRRRNYAAV